MRCCLENGHRPGMCQTTIIEFAISLSIYCLSLYCKPINHICFIVLILIIVIVILFTDSRLRMLKLYLPIFASLNLTGYKKKSSSPSMPCSPTK